MESPDVIQVSSRSCRTMNVDLIECSQSIPLSSTLQV
jgi:hypothetical protein